jgi:hypothetical protein
VLLSEGCAVANHFVLFVSFVPFVRNPLFQQERLTRDSGSHKVHQVHKEHKEGGFITFHIFQQAHLQAAPGDY